jgi:DNA-binding transcriptional LysR family regulator
MREPILDPELLKAFVAVARQRSFTRAATTLNRTQSAVSMQIRRLEERIGARLFHRTNGDVLLSSAGESLLGYAEQILTLGKQAVAQLRERRVEGTVRLGVMDDYGTRVLPALLADFMAEHPQVHVALETGLTATMPARLGEAYDLVIAMHPEGHIEGELLCRDQAVWAVGAQPVELQDPLPVALYPQGCLFRAWATSALDTARRRWRLAFVSPNPAAVESIAAEGLAVTVVKAGTFPNGLRALSEQDGMPPLPAAEIRLHRAPDVSAAASLLADHLRSTMTAGAPAFG